MTEIIDYETAITIASSSYEEALEHLIQYQFYYSSFKNDLIIQSGYHYRLLMHPNDFDKLEDEVKITDQCTAFICGWERCKES